MPDWIEDGPHHEFVTACRSASSIAASLLRTHQQVGLPTPAVPDLILVIVTQGQFSGTFDFGAGAFDAVTPPHAITFAPAHTPCQYNVHGDGHLLGLTLPHAPIQQLLSTHLDRPPLDFAHLHAGAFFDPLIESLCARLWDEALARHPNGTLFADVTLNALLLALYRRADRPIRPPNPTAQLSNLSLKRVVDFMHDHHAHTINLDDLAAVARVSRFHFARLFRRTTGLPPHQFLIRLRIGRLLDLLRHRRSNISELAAVVGFTDQSHLARHCRRLLGCTPANLRTPPKIIPCSHIWEKTSKIVQSRTPPIE